MKYQQLAELDLAVTIWRRRHLRSGARVAVAADSSGHGVNVGRVGFSPTSGPRMSERRSDQVRAGTVRVEDRLTLTMRRHARSASRPA